MKKYMICSSSLFAALLVLFILTLLYSRSWKHALFLDPLHRIDTTETIVALTFDDGPSESRTPALMQLLDRHGVKATFFMMGENIEKHPQIARAVYESGHLIGNHTYSHPRLILKKRAYIREEIIKTDSLIRTAGQKEVLYFRPPYCTKLILLPLELRRMKKVMVTGTYDPPSEYLSPFDAKKVAAEMIANTKPGSVIFLHDGKESESEAFIRSVDMMISGLKDRGYRFVRLDGNQ